MQHRTLSSKFRPSYYSEGFGLSGLRSPLASPVQQLCRQGKDQERKVNREEENQDYQQGCINRARLEPQAPGADDKSSGAIGEYSASTATLMKTTAPHQW